MSVSETGVREDGVEVCGESVERNMLLWTAWGVWKARVVGTLEGRVSSVDVEVQGFGLCWSRCIPKKMVSSRMFCLSGGGMASASIWCCQSWIHCCISFLFRPIEQWIWNVGAMSTSASTYFQSLRGVVTTQPTTDKSELVRAFVSLHNMCANERERELHLLDHVQLASILATQLGSECEAILLREGVLRDAVAEKDELIHRRSEKGRKVSLTAGGIGIYLLVEWFGYG